MKEALLQEENHRQAERLGIKMPQKSKAGGKSGQPKAAAKSMATTSAPVTTNQTATLPVGASGPVNSGADASSQEGGGWWDCGWVVSWLSGAGERAAKEK
jgi:hypothetical protein